MGVAFTAIALFLFSGCSDSTSDSASTSESTSDAAGQTDSAEAGSINPRVCEALRDDVRDSLDAFLNDGLDPVPGDSPTPETLREMLSELAVDSEALADLELGVLSTAASSVVDATRQFEEFLDKHGDIRVYTDTAGDSPISDELNEIIGSIDFEGIDNALCEADSTSDSTASDAAVADRIAALVRTGPEGLDACPLFTGSEYIAALGLSMTPQGSSGTLRSRDGLGDTVFCFFDSEGGNSNMLAFTDTSSAVEDIAAQIEAQDLGSAALADVTPISGLADGTGYLAEDDGSAYGLWIAAGGEWGLAVFAPSLDAAGLEGAVKLAKGALA